MSNTPLNAEVLQGIARTSFYGQITSMESRLVHPKLTTPITQEDLTVTYTAFGEVPEPRQLSGSVASTGQRKAHGLGDFKLVGTVVEWEQTVEVPRSVIETNSSEIERITSSMARKAMIYMDRRFVADILPASTAGYDTVSLYNDSHLESGTAQDNNVTSAAGTGTAPTATELEAQLDIEVAALEGFTDDKGTPVNIGVEGYTILVPTAFRALYAGAVEPLKQQSPGLDVSGGTGRWRGLFTILSSPFIATADRHYTFADNPDTKAVALLKNKDFEFVTNIGTDSDKWRLDQMAVFSSYARWEFIPWDWKVTMRQVWT